MISRTMARRTKQTPEPAAPTDPKLERITLIITDDLMERVRNAAYWTPGETLSSIGARGVEKEIRRLEKVNGGPFAPRTQAVRRGRPPA